MKTKHDGKKGIALSLLLNVCVGTYNAEEFFVTIIGGKRVPYKDGGTHASEKFEEECAIS